MASNDDDVCEFLFQYPQSGSRRCRLRLCIRTTCSNIYFSTLKAGRDAAALFSLFLTEKFLKFQYPQSGSRRCRPQPHHQFVTNGKISVPSKRVETLPPRMYQTLRTYMDNFSTLKAGRDAAAISLNIVMRNLQLDFSTLKAGRDAAAQGYMLLAYTRFWYFSTLKAGRDAAALCVRRDCAWPAPISVPSKRVETLPHCVCKIAPKLRRVISVPSKRVETLPPSSPAS